MIGSNTLLLTVFIAAAAIIVILTVDAIIFAKNVSRRFEKIKQSPEHNNIINAIRSGAYTYSESKIEVEARGYAWKLELESSKRRKVTFAIVFLLCMPSFAFGMEAAMSAFFVIAMLYLGMYINTSNAEKYETHLSALKKLANSFEKNKAHSSSTVDEIKKLHVLHENGVLSQAEYEAAKAALLKKIA
jgi:hypothetical protein